MPNARSGKILEGLELVANEYNKWFTVVLLRNSLIFNDSYFYLYTDLASASVEI